MCGSQRGYLNYSKLTNMARSSHGRSQRTLEEIPTHSFASALSRKRELLQMVRVKGSIDHTSLAATNTSDIVGVLRARRKVEGKEKRRKKGGADGGEGSASYM